MGKNRFFALAGGDFFLIHGNESFERVFPSRSVGEILTGSNIARIGRVSPLPILNCYRPDVEFIRYAHVYSIKGLDSEEWIFVRFFGGHRANPLRHWNHIYRSTSFTVECPLDFIERHLDYLASLQK